MTKKLQSTEHTRDMQLKDAVRNSAQNIWQASVGVFATAREESSDLLARLRKEGASLQTRTQQMAGKRISNAIARMTETIGKQTAGSLVRMEEVFEERVTRALHSFGVPTQNDLKALTEEIDDLRKTVSALSNGSAKGKKAASTAAKTKEKTTVNGGARKSITRTRNEAAPKKQAKPAAENRI